jgi:hypothetical protein
MAKTRKAPATDFDSPWKVALDHYFEPCMAFFFPHAHADTDWSRGHEMLDKEPQPIVRRAKHGRRYVDKLVKVWLEDGQEKWLLIHVEVQSLREGEFPQRMHVYNHRIFDRYDQEVVSLAILADDDPDWRPTRYESARWGFRTLTEFPIVKLLDYAPQYQRLEADPNPFAVVVLAHLKALETRRSPDERRAWKVRLVKALYGQGRDSEDVRRLFAFIDRILELPEPMNDRFWDEIDAYQEEMHMPFVSIADRMGRVKGLLDGIEVALDLKFGPTGLELMPELRPIRDPELLGRVLARIKTADSPSDLRRAWTRERRPKKTETP